MDKRGRRWIGVHNQTFQTGEWAEEEGIEKDAPEGGEILESALSVHQAKEALRQRRPVSFGRRYHGLGGNGPGHMVRIEESSPARAADRDGMTSVKRGFTIRLDERKIHIYQVEEGYEDRERSGDSGSD